MPGLKSFDENAMEAFFPMEKTCILATVNPKGMPHITFLNSIRAHGPRQITMGEFCRGMSKAHVRENHKAAFLVITQDQRMWRGHARWTHHRDDGPEYREYNDLSVFRHNSCHGLRTVHYFDLVDLQGSERLPLAAVKLSKVTTRLLKRSAAVHGKGRILTPFSERLLNRADTLKFIAWIKPDGFPEIVPVPQCLAAGSRRLIFTKYPFEKELSRISEGLHVAIFALTPQMESILVRGVYSMQAPSRLIRTGILDIDWVYNSIPPMHGQIYPPLPLSPVVRWADFPWKD